MPYSHFRYIGYQVPTVAKDSDNPNTYKHIHGIPPGKPVAKVKGHKVKLIGLENNPYLENFDDLKIRLERLIGALMLAKRKVDKYLDDEEENHQLVLNVFIAPEFYFRPNNDRLAYSHKEFRTIVDVLRQTIDSGPYKNWVIVPGTIMWCKQKNGVEVYYNTSLYICKSGSRTIEKYEASPIDGLPTGRHGGEWKEDDNRCSTDEFDCRYQHGPFVKRRIFRINGIVCGIEICLDHSIRVLKDYILENDIEPVDLQFFPAGHQKIKEDGIATKKKGYILKCDGIERKYTELKKIKRYHHWKSGSNGTNYFDHINDCCEFYDPDIKPFKEIPIKKNHVLYIKPPKRGFLHDQAIQIYPLQKIYHQF